MPFKFKTYCQYYNPKHSQKQSTGKVILKCKAVQVLGEVARNFNDTIGNQNNSCRYGSRFRGYAILEATLYPMQQNPQPQWHEPEHSLIDIPAVVVNGCAYVIDQFENPGDESEFSRERPDLTPALAIMFQMQ